MHWSIDAFDRRCRTVRTKLWLHSRILTMVLSIITLAATVPLLATSTIQLQDQSEKVKDQNELEFKTEKCHLGARASSRMSQKRQDQFRDTQVVLREGFLFLEKLDEPSHSHPFAGYLLPYPEKDYDGIVSTINAENMLNWVFVDKESYQLRHGIRADAQSQLTGPMSLTSSDGEEWHFAFDGWEGFVAVEQDDGWTLYFDKDDNGLSGRRNGRAVVEIELFRSPLRQTREIHDDPD